MPTPEPSNELINQFGEIAYMRVLATAPNSPEFYTLVEREQERLIDQHIKERNTTA